MYFKRLNKGFTLIELISVMVILGLLSVVVVQKSLSTSTLQLQASRDVLLTSFLAAQQFAMSQNKKVSITTLGSTIDILEDSDDDGIPDTSATVLTETYPITIDATLSSETFIFDKLGHTTAGAITVTKGSATVNVTVTATGYVY